MKGRVFNLIVYDGKKLDELSDELLGNLIKYVLWDFTFLKTEISYVGIIDSKDSLIEQKFTEQESLEIKREFLSSLLKDLKVLYDIVRKDDNDCKA